MKIISHILSETKQATHNFISIKKSLLPLLFILFGSATSFVKLETNKTIVVAEPISLYQELQLSKLGLKQDIFSKAVTGWSMLSKTQHSENSNMLSIADLSQSSNLKRLYVIDMENKKVLFNTYVAHGRNSGEEFAHFFSNKLNSYQSSLGFYLTENTYQGTHGLSMKLKGIEKGINDVAEERGIVMHAADYVCDAFIKQNGRLGRSQGCPAVSQEFCQPIINAIKNGSYLFMFYPDSNYLHKSILL